MKAVRHVIVTTTVETLAQASILSKGIIQSRLATCVQFWPIKSIYHWKGKVVSGREYLLLCKTQATIAKELQTHIRSRHAYELPEIICIPISAGLPEYLNWITHETCQPSKTRGKQRVKSLTFQRQAIKRAVAKKHGKS